MQKIFLIIFISWVLASCGVKDDPEYKSQKNHIKIIHLV